MMSHLREVVKISSTRDLLGAGPSSSLFTSAYSAIIHKIMKYSVTASRSSIKLRNHLQEVVDTLGLLGAGPSSSLVRSCRTYSANIHKIMKYSVTASRSST